MESKALKNVLNVNGAEIIGMYLVVSIGFSVTCPNFLKSSNIMTGIRQTIYMAIVTFVMTLVISLGGTNLSVGSTVGIGGIALVAMILEGYNIYLVIGMVTLLGAFIGLVNGLLVARLRIAYFIVALGIMDTLRGLTYMHTKGIPLYSLRYPEVQLVGQGYIGIIPFPIILTLITLLARYYFFYKTKFGRYTISISSSEDAARLVGINVDKVKILVFMLSGVLYAIMGVILASRSEAAVPEAGNAYEMDTIAATVIGGTGIPEGKENMVGTTFGVILMVTIKNDLSLLNVNTFWHQVTIGTFILFAMALDGHASNQATRDR